MRRKNPKLLSFLTVLLLLSLCPFKAWALIPEVPTYVGKYRLKLVTSKSEISADKYYVILQQSTKDGNLYAMNQTFRTTGAKKLLCDNLTTNPEKLDEDNLFVISYYSSKKSLSINSEEQLCHLLYRGKQQFYNGYLQERWRRLDFQHEKSAGGSCFV